MEIIVLPFERGSSMRPRLKPAKVNVGSGCSCVCVCVFSNKRMAARTHICLLFEHCVFSANWTKPRLTHYINRRSCWRKSSCDVKVGINKGQGAKSLVLFNAAPPIQQHCLIVLTKCQSKLFSRSRLQGLRGNACFFSFLQAAGIYVALFTHLTGFFVCTWRIREGRVADEDQIIPGWQWSISPESFCSIYSQYNKTCFRGWHLSLWCCPDTASETTLPRYVNAWQMLT